MRTILPAFQFLIILVELCKKFSALVRHLIGRLNDRLLDFSGLDYYLGLHTHLRVFILHDDYFGLLSWYYGDLGH